MFRVLALILFIILQDILVQCYMPILTVQRLDTKLIQRKRQDTKEICRAFNAENERLKVLDRAVAAQRRPAIKHTEIVNKKYRPKREIYDFEDIEPEAPHRRSKRDTYDLPGNPLLNLDDIQRVESIVDKLYDDVEENGTKVTYRQPLSKITTKKVETNKSGRRFDFAPKLLLGPDDEPEIPPEKLLDTGLHVQVWQKRWPNGIIPYFVDPKTYDNLLVDQIRRAFDYFERATCIRLQRLREKPRDRESMENVEWVYITNPGGIRQCVHSNERKLNKGVQIIVFGYDCLSLGEIVHEVMHILGFSHEHTRPDRDKHISIMWDNIKPGYKKYFSLRNEDTLIHLPYDYASVLHYPQRAFSKNGQLTIKVNGDIKFGQREALSDIDIEKVSLIYGMECMNRNKQYLLTTCPSVVKKTDQRNATLKEITDYFKDRIWDYGIVNYKYRDMMEFSAEERENIQAVMRHIEKETCIEFRNLGATDKSDSEESKETANEKLNYKSTVLGDSTAKLTTTVKTVDTDNFKSTIMSSDSDNKLSSVEVIDNGKTGDLIHNHTSNISGSDNEVQDNTIGGDTGSEEKDLGDTYRKGPRTIILVDGDNTMKSNTDEGSNRVKRSAYRPLSPTRRHASNVLILTRSPELGCKCPDKPGRGDGNQELPIYTDCFNSVNDLLHLFVHVLGLDHQHNMHDRDDYLHIVWDALTDAIKKDMKNTLPPAADAGYPYDYQSVMHFPWLEIRDGVTNIMYPIWNDGWAMGHWQGLSTIDVQKINKIYADQCSKRKQYAQGKKNTS